MASCVGIVGLIYLEVPPSAEAQVNAIARWDMNDDPLSPTNEGVADVAGAPSPDFPGDAYGDIQRCSEAGISTPKGTGDCVVLDDGEYIAGDKGEHLFPGDSQNQYSGSRSILAWVRISSQNSVIGDHAIVHIGRNSPETNYHCDSYDDDANCAGFHLYLTNGYPAVGNGQGNSGAVIGCTSNSLYKVDSSTNFGNWFFIVGTYDHNAAEDNDATTLSTKLYLNGTKCAEGSIYYPKTAVDQDARWSIGAFIDQSGSIGNGALTAAVDDVRVFDRAMGLNEIQALYVSSSNGG